MERYARFPILIFKFFVIMSLSRPIEKSESRFQSKGRRGRGQAARSASRRDREVRIGLRGSLCGHAVKGDMCMSHDDAKSANAQKGQHPTPLLDQLEAGPWPSFVTGLKRLRDSGDKQ